MIRHRLLGLVSAVALAAACGSALAQVGTAITYQGQLKNAGSPVNTATDMEFSLWDSAVGGSQIGSTVTSLAVPVSQGLFTASMDFGVDPYDSDQAVYLQIAVRNPAGAGAYVPMGSRQRLTAAPYSAATRGINVDAAGKVGIGTTTPGGFLEVSQGGAGPSATPVLKLTQPANTWGTVAVHDAFRYLTTAGGDPNLTSQKQFNVGAGGVSIGYPNVPGYGSNDALYVSGNVGIGTNTPASKLDVNGTSRLRGSCVMDGNLTVSNGTTYFAGFEHRFDGFFSVNRNFDGTVGASFGTGGRTWATYAFGPAGGTLPWNNTSDRRLKDHIETITHPMEYVRALRGVTFDWRCAEFPDKQYPAGRQVGFIAQEVQEVLPEVVTQSPDGHLGITYTGLIPVLTEAIKVQDQQISALTARIDTLEARLHSAAAVPTVQSSVAWPALAACAGIGLIAVRRRSAAK